MAMSHTWHSTRAVIPLVEWTFLQTPQIVFTEAARTSAKPPNGGSINKTSPSLLTNAWNTFSLARLPKKKWLNMLYQQNLEDEKNWPCVHKTELILLINTFKSHEQLKANQIIETYRKTGNIADVMFNKQVAVYHEPKASDFMIKCTLQVY